MRYYMLAMESGESEVGGYAEFRIDEHGNQIIHDTTVLRQEASHVHFTISEKSNALWLEDIVGKGKDPSNFFLFHTHPTGMDSSMSGVDVKQVEEMARDLPGIIVRSMILTQGKLHPTINEAMFLNGRMWRRDNISIVLLDDTGANADLRQIGWFDKPKEHQYQMSPHSGRGTKDMRGFTHGYGSGAAASKSRELVPLRQPSDGWFDEYPMESERSTLNAYQTYLDDKKGEADRYLLEPDHDFDDDAEPDDEAEDFIGSEVWYKGAKVTVIDAYVVNGDVVLVMPDNSNISLEEVTMCEGQEAS